MAVKEEILIQLDFETNDFTSRAQELNGEIAQLTKNQRELNKSGQEGTVQFQNNVTAIRSNKKELNEINKVIDNVTKANKSNAGSNEQLKAQLSILTLEFNKLSKAERENGARGKELSASINKVTKDLKANEKAVGNNRREVGNYGKNIIDTKGQLTKFATGLVGVTALLAAGTAALNFMVDSFKDANNAMKISNQLFNESDENIKELTANALALANTFDKDVNDVLLSASALSAEFGISGVEAMQLVEDGFLKGADANGEFLDTLKEFPAQLKTVGLSASETIAIITQSNQSGVFSDKGIDSIKEAGLRLRELTPSTKEAIDAIGLSGDEIQKQIEAGTISLFEATQKISNRIAELPAESNEVGTAIADIFGGAGEDAGLRFITGIGQINLELDEMENKVDELDQANLELSKTWNGLAVEGSNLNGILGGIVDSLNTTLSSFSEVLELPFENLFDIDNAENMAAAWTDLGGAISDIYAPGAREALNLNRVNEVAVEKLTAKINEYTTAQLQTDKAQKVVISNLQKTGLTLDEATAKYKGIITAQLESAAAAEQEKQANETSSEAIAQSAANNKAAADARKKAVQDGLKLMQEELALFITSQGTRAKSLEEELEIAKQVGEKELAILEEQRENKLISETKFQDEKLQIQQEFGLRQSEIVIENANRELQTIVENNASKIEAGQFLTEELFAQEQLRLQNKLEAELAFQATRLEEGEISETAFNEKINEVNEANRLANEELEIERAEAEAEVALVDAENQAEIDAEKREAVFEQKQFELDEDREQELLNAKKTGADIELINKKFDNFDRKLEKDKRKAQVSEAANAFAAIGSLAAGNAEAAKAIAVAQAIINAYQGITAVLAAQSVIPEPFGSILKGVSAVAIGVTAFQNVSKIRSTKVPKAAKGMILGGASHAGGGVELSADGIPFANAERGELLTIVNEKNTTLLRQLSSANEYDGNGVPFFGRGGLPQFQDGGISTTAITSNVEQEVGTTNQLIEAVESLPTPIVLVEDIAEKAADQEEIEVRVTL